ncbi:MAG: peroxiredoxin, partial [Enterobacter mori]|nr:peroxiredoxin [Enterobacter mori]
MVLVTRPAPDFTAAAVLGNGEIVENFNFKQHTNGKATVLFFWPMDFTFVCPSELIAFDKRYEEFQKRGVEVVGVSFDSEFVHNAWRNTPVENGGIGAVKYAMVADIKREIQQAYGIEHPDAGVALRGSFLIDANGIVRHQVVWLNTCPRTYPACNRHGLRRRPAYAGLFLCLTLRLSPDAPGHARQQNHPCNQHTPYQQRVHPALPLGRGGSGQTLLAA